VSNLWTNRDPTTRTLPRIYGVHSLWDFRSSRLFPHLKKNLKNCRSNEVWNTWGFNNHSPLFHPTTMRDSDISQTDLVHSILKTKEISPLDDFLLLSFLIFITSKGSPWCTLCASLLSLGLGKFTCALLVLSLSYEICTYRSHMCTHWVISPLNFFQHLMKCRICALFALVSPLRFYTYVSIGALLMLALCKLMLYLLSYLNL